MARRLRWDPSDLVAVVDTLERDGLAVRRRDPADRRRYALEITTEGSAWVRAAVTDAAGPKTAALLSALDADEIT